MLLVVGITVTYAVHCAVNVIICQFGKQHIAAAKLVVLRIYGHIGRWMFDLNLTNLIPQVQTKADAMPKRLNSTVSSHWRQQYELGFIVILTSNIFEPSA
jgi:hypothetical protein